MKLTIQINSTNITNTIDILLNKTHLKINYNKKIYNTDYINNIILKLKNIITLYTLNGNITNISQKSFNLTDVNNETIHTITI